MPDNKNKKTYTNPENAVYNIQSWMKANVNPNINPMIDRGIVNGKYINPATMQPYTMYINKGLFAPGNMFSEQIKYLKNPSIRTMKSTNSLMLDFAYNQSGAEKTKLGLTALGYNLLAGIGAGLGTTISIKSGLEATGLLQGDIDNAFLSWVDKIRDKGEKSLSNLYLTNPNTSFNPTDPSWWFKNMAEGAYSGGIMLEAVFETILVEALTRGSGTELEVLANAKKFAKAGNLFKALKTLSKSNKIKSSFAKWAVFRRYTESVMEARDTYKQINQALLQNGYNKEEAAILSSRSASSTFLGQMPLAVLDGVMAYTMFVNPVTGATEGALEKLASITGKKLIDKSIVFTLDALGEGGEELWQTWVQDESYYKAMAQAGLESPKTLSSRFGDYIKKQETWEAFWAGVTGGIFLPMASGLVGMAGKRKAEHVYNEKLEQYKKISNGLKWTYINNINKAREKGDIATELINQRLLNLEHAIERFYFDENFEDDRSASAHKDMLENVIEGLTNKDEQLLKDMKITSDEQRQVALNLYNQMLKDMNTVQSVYNQLRDKVDKHSLRTATYYGLAKKLLEGDLKDKQTIYQQVLQDFVPSDISIQYLEHQLNYDIKKELYENQKKYVEDNRKNKDFNIKQAVKKLKRLEKDFKKSENTIKSLEKSNKELAKTEFEKIENLKETEFDGYKFLAGKYVNVIKTKNALDNVTEKYNKWTSLEHQYEIAKGIKIAEQESFKIKKDLEKVIKKEKKEKRRKEKKKNKSKTKDTETSTNTENTEEVKQDEKPETKDNKKTSTKQEDVEVTNLDEVLGNPITEPENDEKNNDENPEKDESNETEVTNPVDVIDANVVFSPEELNDIKKENEKSDKNKTNTKSDDEYSQEFTVFTELLDDILSNSENPENVGSLMPKISEDESEISRESRRVAMANILDKFRELNNREATFEDILKIFKERLDNQPLSDIYNYIVEAWLDNGKEKIDFKKVYENIIDPYELDTNVFTTNNTEKEIKNNEKETKRKDTEIVNDNKVEQDEKTETELLTTDSEDEQWFKNTELENVKSERNPEKQVVNSFDELSVMLEEDDVDEVKVISDNLKAQFIFVDKNGNPIYSSDINPEKCVDYNYLKPGKKFTIKFADNYQDVFIKIYANASGEQYSNNKFGTIVGEEYEIDDRFIELVPLVAVDNETGEQIFLIPNTTWYNIKNVGYEYDLGKQKQLIKEARKVNKTFRKLAVEKIMNGEPLEITITEVNGDKSQMINKGEKKKLLSEMDNSIELAVLEREEFVSEDGVIGIKNGHILDENIVENGDLPSDRYTIDYDRKRVIKYSKYITTGSIVEIRRMGYIDVNGEQFEYYKAFRVSTKSIDTSFNDKNPILDTIKFVFKNLLSPSEDDKRIVEALNNQLTGNYQIDNIESAINYLRNFIIIRNRKPDKSIIEAHYNSYTEKLQAINENVINSVEAEIQSEDNIPYIIRNGNRLILGVTNSNVFNKESDGIRLKHITIDFSHPSAKQYEYIEKFLNKYSDKFSFNISSVGLQDFKDRNFPLIVNHQGRIVIATDKNYKSFAKRYTFSSVKEYKLSSGKTITRIQPVIHFKPDISEEEWNKNYQDTTFSVYNSKKVQIISKPDNEQEIKNNEQKISEKKDNIVFQQENTSETKKHKLSEEELNALDEVEEALKDLKNILPSDINISLEPKYISDSLAKRVQKSLIKVEDLDIKDYYSVLDYLVNMTGILLNNNEKISVAKLKIFINNTIIDSLEGRYSEIEKQLNNLKNVLEKHKSVLQSEKIAEINNYINYLTDSLSSINIIFDNIDVFTEDVLQEVKNKLGFQNSKDDLSIDFEEMNEGYGGNEEAEIEQVDDEGYEKNYSKSAVEINFKEKVPNKLRRILIGIQDKDNKGNIIKGSFGLPKFVSFDDVYDILVELILEDGDIEADFDIMLNKIKDKKDKYKWLDEVIERLENLGLQTRNQFVTTFSKHFIEMKSPVFKTDKKGTTLSLFDTNSSNIRILIQQNWDVGFLSSGIYEYEDGNYKINKEFLKELIRDFEKLAPVNTYKHKLKLDKNHKLVTDIIKKIPINNRNGIEVTEQELINLGLQSLVKEALGNNNIATFDFSFRGDINYLNSLLSVEKLDNGNYNFTIVSSSISNIEKIKEWTDKLGMNLQIETLKHLKERGISIVGKTKIKRYTIKDMFDTSNISKSYSIFGNIYNMLKSLDSLNKDVISDEEIKTITSSLGMLGYKFAGIEGYYNKKVKSLSVYDNGKTIYLPTLPKFITDETNRLRKLSYRKELQELSLTHNSITLKVLDEDKKFQELFKVYHLAKNSLKELGNKIFKDNNITDLSSIEHEFVKVILAQDTKTPQLSYTNNGIKLKVFHLLSPTMSDKTQGIIIDLPLLDLTTKEITVDNKGNVVLSDNLKKLLFEQLVLPEIERIVKSYKNNIDSNIKDYDIASRMFNIFPHINTISTKENGHILDFIKTHNTQEVIEAYYDNISNIISQYITTRISEKETEWENNGYFSRKENGINFKYFDKQFLKQDKFKDLKDNEKLKLIISEYFINNLLGNTEVTKLYSGDLSYYVPEKNIRKLFEVDKDNNPILSKPKFGNDSYMLLHKAMQDNASKRFALLSAPGMRSVNAEKELYTQIQVKDKITIASNIDYLIELYYGKEKRKELQPIIDRLREVEKELDVNGFDSQLVAEKIGLENKLRSSGLDKIQDYLSITSTDAQEYTTITETLNLLLGFGKISKAEYDTIIDKVKKYKKLEREGKEIPNNLLLTDKEMSLVLQPMKPVYAGKFIDKDNDTSHVVYIKSASITLIPGVTKGKKLDDIRKLMERVEDETKTSIRLSYQSANKVGAVKNPISLFDETGNVRVFTTQEIKNSSLRLSRKDFKIQQEAPYKAGKPEPNLISLGTQMLKELFGNDFVKNQFEFEGETISGKELVEKYNTYFNMLISQLNKELYNSLGVTDTNLIDEKVFAKNVLRIIKKEAEKRGHNPLELKGIDTKVINKDGKNITTFTIPLWLLPNSEKFEALLISLIRNNIIKIKMPGYGFVASSSQGWKLLNQKDFTNDDMVYTSNYDFEKGLQSAHTKEDGTLQKTQIFIPSRFKNSKGELIDILNDKRYWEYDEKGHKILKKGMIEDELLSMITFRIPTSSHVSMENVEIAGFIPLSQGDIVVLPDTVIVKKGLDFDWDKEFAYQLWHEVDDETGEIYTVDTNEDPSNVLNRIQKLHNRIDELLDEIEKGKEEKKEIYYTLKNRKELSELTGKYNHKGYSELEKEVQKLEKDLEEVKGNINKSYDLIKKVKENIVSTEDYHKKVLQNKIIRIHQSVLSNPNKEIQSKINKPLTVDFELQQSILIDNLLRENNTSNVFKIFIDGDYQREAMLRGSSGKMAIGVYSQYVTLNSLLQQVDKKLITNETFHINSFDKNGRPVLLESEKEFGRIKTLDGERTISEVFEERQNTATDDMKLNILGKVNVNRYTISVDSILSLLGFDKGYYKVKDEQGNEIIKPLFIPYAFLSQPIIRDYVAEMEKVNSSLAGFISNKELYVAKSLLLKYGIITDLDQIKNEKDLNETFKKAKEFSVQDMYNSISGKEIDNFKQLGVFVNFLQLKSLADEIRLLQHALNTNSNFQSTFLELTELDTELDDIINNNEDVFSIIENPNIVLGDIYDIENLTDEQVENYLKQGAVIRKNKLIVPNNPTSAMVLTSVKGVNDLWGKFYIYLDENINKYVDDILSDVSGNIKNKWIRLRLKKEIFKNLKIFFYTDDTKLLNNNSISEERKRLLVDTDDNTSLAKYLREVINNTTVFNNNPFIQRLDFDVKLGNDYSIIKFNNPNGGILHEDMLYTAIAEMLNNDTRLPDYNYNDSNIKELDKDITNNIQIGDKYYVDIDNKVGVEYGERKKFKKGNLSYKIVKIGEVDYKTAKKYNKDLKSFKGTKNLYTIKPFYTVKDLAQDLINYSIFTKPVREAVQFINYIPIEYFKNTGFANNLLKFDSRLDEAIFDKILGQRVPGSKINIFKMQFFMNNPDLAFRVKTKKDLEQIAVTNITIEDKSKGKGIVREFVAMRDKKDKKQFRLYMWTDNGFKEIDTFGNYAVSEYEIGNVEPKPILAEGKQEIETTPGFKPGETVVTIRSVDEIIEVIKKNNSLKNALGFITKLNINDNNTSQLAKLVNYLIDDDIKIIFKNLNDANGMFYYDNERQLIILDNSLANNPNALIKTLIHEAIHSITAQEIDKYFIFDVNTMNYKLRDDVTIPKHTKDLLDIYQTALEHFKNIPEYKSMIKKIKNILNKDIKDNVLTQEEYKYYPLYDLKEFVAGIFTNKTFQKMLDNINYDEHQTLLDKFLSFIRQMIERLGITFRENSLLTHSLYKSLTFINKEFAGKMQERDLIKRKEKYKGILNNNSFMSKVDDTFDNTIGKEIGKDNINYNFLKQKYREHVASILSGLEETYNGFKFPYATLSIYYSDEKYTRNNSMQLFTENDGDKKITIIHGTKILKTAYSSMQEIKDNIDKDVTNANKQGYDLLSVFNTETGQNFTFSTDQTKYYIIGSKQDIQQFKDKIDYNSIEFENTMRILENSSEESKKVILSEDENYYLLDGKKFLRQSNYLVDKVVSNENMKKGAAIGDLIDEIARNVFSNTMFNTDTIISDIKQRTGYGIKVDKEVIDRVVNRLISIKQDFESLGYRIISKDLFFKTYFKEEFAKEYNADGVAGKLDMVLVDDNGNVVIIDFKNKKDTGRFLFNDLFVDDKYPATIRKWIKQQSIYKVLLINNGIKVESLNVLPFFTDYEREGNQLILNDIQLGKDKLDDYGEYESDLHDNLIQMEQNEFYIADMDNETTIEKPVKEEKISQSDNQQKSNEQEYFSELQDIPQDVLNELDNISNTDIKLLPKILGFTDNEINEGRELKEKCK